MRGRKRNRFILPHSAEKVFLGLMLTSLPKDVIIILMARYLSPDKESAVLKMDGARSLAHTCRFFYRCHQEWQTRITESILVKWRSEQQKSLIRLKRQNRKHVKNRRTGKCYDENEWCMCNRCGSFVKTYSLERHYTKCFRVKECLDPNCRVQFPWRDGAVHSDMCSRKPVCDRCNQLFPNFPGSSHQSLWCPMKVFPCEVVDNGTITPCQYEAPDCRYKIHRCNARCKNCQEIVRFLPDGTVSHRCSLYRTRFDRKNPWKNKNRWITHGKNEEKKSQV